MLNPYAAAIRQGLKEQESVRTHFLGTSMLPTLRSGMQISVMRVKPEEIKPADIIIYQNGPSLVVHRVIKIVRKQQKRIFVAKGDNHAYIDCDYIPQEDLLGRITAAFAPTSTEKDLLIKDRLMAKLYCLSGNFSLFCRENRNYVPAFIRMSLRGFVGGFFQFCKKMIHSLYGTKCIPADNGR